MGIIGIAMIAGALNAGGCTCKSSFVANAIPGEEFANCASNQPKKSSHIVN